MPAKLSLLDRLCALLARFGFYLCDARQLRRLQPGRTRMAEARGRLGPPHAQWLEADGGMTLEFSRQPQGARCYMLRFDADGVLRDVEQVLNESRFDRIQPGMTDETVRRLLGTPARSLRYALKGESEWRWRLEDDASIGHPVYFSVEFDDAMRVLRSGRFVDRRGD